MVQEGYNKVRDATKSFRLICTVKELLLTSLLHSTRVARSRSPNSSTGMSSSPVQSLSTNSERLDQMSLASMKPQRR